MTTKTFANFWNIVYDVCSIIIMSCWIMVMLVIGMLDGGELVVILVWCLFIAYIVICNPSKELLINRLKIAVTIIYLFVFYNLFIKR